MNKTKVIKYFFDIIIIILIFVTISGARYIVESKVLKNQNANFFGYTFLKVMTGSMSGTIEIGNIVIVKLTKDVKENDIIVYKEDNELITHRLIYKDGDNLITKGDANNKEDNPLTINQVLGRVEKIIK